MATLSTLKLTAAVKPTSVPAVQLRRNNLVLRLWEQCELAKAEAAGTTFAPVKFRSVVEHDTGIRQQVANAQKTLAAAHQTKPTNLATNTPSSN